jgi:hypothetical protein
VLLPEQAALPHTPRADAAPLAGFGAETPALPAAPLARGRTAPGPVGTLLAQNASAEMAYNR